MRTLPNLPAPAIILAIALAFAAHPARAHVVAGARVFPVTLTFDDPGVSDEASLPSITYNRAGATNNAGPSHTVQTGWEVDKTITDTTALIVNDGYTVQQTSNAKTRAGWQNLVVTGKWQAYTNDDHEFAVSLGIIREFGGTGTLHTGADAFGSTTPTAYFGKGLNELPIPVLQPFALTGELGFTIADKSLKQMQLPSPNPGPSPLLGSMAQSVFNNGNNNAWAGALSLQYSIPYFQSQIRNIGLTGILANVVPLVEFTWASPASSPANQPTTWTAAPGAIVEARSTIAVTDASGKRVDDGMAHLEGANTKLAVILKTIPAGAYKVVWHATDDDGHKTQGKFAFTVTQ